MKTITIHTKTSQSGIFIGETLSNLSKYLPGGKAIIITDEKIKSLYGNQFQGLPVITIGMGEPHKTMTTLEHVFDRLIEYEADRSTFIVAVGGGIVCDVAGFAASVYMRGLRYGFVSTTLLSQVDASVGGKNGVNFRGYKNMIGVFNQPEFVLIDTGMLRTMDDREYRSGFAEIVKAAAIKSKSFFQFLEDHYDKALQKTPEIMEKIIYESIQIKASVVEQDEKEKGERKQLNFGHTFAHSIEHNTGMLHGEAVSIGMILAGNLSVKLDLLDPKENERLALLLRNLKLPVDYTPEYPALISAMRKDKKRQGDDLHMVFLEHLGEAVIKKISIKQLEKIYL